MARPEMPAVRHNEAMVSRPSRRASPAPPAAAPPREVALVIETSKAYGRGVLKGISTWLHQRRDWMIAIDERGLDDPAPDWLARWPGQGVITRLGEEAAGTKKAAKVVPLDAREQACFEQLKQVPFGSWFEFTTNQQGDKVRRKLCWFSNRDLWTNQCRTVIRICYRYAI